MAQSVSILTSTSAAVTGTIVLNPVAKSTTVVLTGSGATSSNCTVQVEFSLDDPTLIPLGGPTATFGLLSSGTAMTASAVAVSSGALSYTVLTPIGQVRVNST